MNRFLADCHLHFEGSLPHSEVSRLAALRGHAFADRAAFEARRSAVRDAQGFLTIYAEVCSLFRSPSDYAVAAAALADSLGRDGVAYAEIYVSPEIFSRLGLEPSACLAAIADGLSSGAAPDTRYCILLDAVRHWGPESADRVLDVYEKNPLEIIVGFGMGGDESSVPAPAFAGVYARARALGLKTSVHAGEWAGPESLRQALDALRPDRVDHGIAAASDPVLLERLADERTVVSVAPSGNVLTGAVGGWEEHPLSRILEAGVEVALGADDPLLFATSTSAEYRAARERLGLSDHALRTLAENSWRGAFCPAAERQAGLQKLASGWPPEFLGPPTRSPKSEVRSAKSEHRPRT